ncbi:YAP1-binding protein 1 [Friedmanniomyces endolithicus]|uniref:YAP1-binding protein 1 n=1 Tax=Friedmanniomyces endolithicus TaxID=329885 RepID=A0AAN6K405_9PEZI|nr:YAP1-binding protein 1 [Friedmanniomyces endolithicus]KAK0772806.1 YAP1-binding protein 1 [Friedmanniomyces endolithicus]KAK0785283.1 YAP1-binding protein 1 [Friedmanniomyces endolithicus]KAK0792880.1 YAP1-binding protein 1 [Friedmanniomyces endolithicus]KAK0836251.1 YAP1-binding protein 1 [Friedmanniomyces endolithicus]
MAEEESQLIKALPPESDYITYLTIVEYNLISDNLPILHKVLQDETLTTNIGWDLVHLLVPFLPESEQCLEDIARLGNPREVILKVTESLRLIEYESPDDESLDEPSQTLAGALDSRVRAESSTYPIKTASTADGEKRPGSSQMVELPPALPLAVSQFLALLSMLAILHPRIKTKYPSRFLSTTLQAILASFANSSMHREEMLLAIIKTVKTITGIRRPLLPTRRSSGMMSAVRSISNQHAADPEGNTGDHVSPEEGATKAKLLQSFVTHITEDYLLNLPPHAEDVPDPSKTFAERFQREEKLSRRTDAIGQIVMLARDLELTDDALLAAAVVVEKLPPVGDQDEAEPPASADEIPLSRVGAVLLYTAMQASAILYDTSSKSTSTAASDEEFTIFPDHQSLLKHCLSSPAHGSGTLGTEPEALLDAILALGLICLGRDSMGEPASDEQFNEYLQVTALLSSNSPSPNLRGHAHYLTTTVLRSQPDDDARLSFIRDTLEHCPFENLKVSAVGWIKGETIEANPPASTPGHLHQAPELEAKSVFATLFALESLAPYLFPSLHVDLISVPAAEAWQIFQLNLSFYLTSLNFLYLLLCAKHLHHSLSIAELWKNNDVAGSFLQPLRDAAKRFGKALDDGGELTDERTPGVIAELMLLDETIERVTNAVRFLNET